MGYIKHNAIVVTSWDDKLLMLAHEKATSISLAVSAPVKSKINRYYSFIVAPDGSKEGWSDSKDGDVLRSTFRRWLREQCHDDGSSSLEWCEVAYGCDDKAATVVASQWDSTKMSLDQTDEYPEPKSFEERLISSVRESLSEVDISDDSNDGPVSSIK